MTRNEAFAELINKRKWYYPLKISAQAATTHKKRFVEGKKVSSEFITNALTLSGYKIEVEEQWSNHNIDILDISKKIKLDPECFKRHYPPHKAWYIKPEYDGIYPALVGVEWIFEEDQKNTDVYWIIGFILGNDVIELQKHHYWIEKRDCIHL